MGGSSANGAVHMSWSDPGDGDFAGVMVRRALGSAAPSSPTDGAAVAEVTARGTSFDDTGVTAGQSYSYALFAHDESGHVRGRRRSWWRGRDRGDA